MSETGETKEGAQDRVAGEELLDILTDAERDSEAIKEIRDRVEAPLLAEIDSLRKRINPDGTPVDISALCAEIDEATDSLTVANAEIAELKKWKADLETSVAAASKIGMGLGEMEFDAWFPGARPKTRKELSAELAAANATLDKLREAIRTQHAELFYVTAAQELRVGFDAKPPESIRDKSKRLGFCEMPAELGQRNLDGETNYVQPPETPDAP